MKTLCNPPVRPRQSWRTRVRRYAAGAGLAFGLLGHTIPAFGDQYQLDASAFNDMAPVNTQTPISGSQGLTGNYYNSRDFSGSVVLSRIDPTVNYDWGAGSPGGAVTIDNFSVRWTGFVSIPSNGSYTFYTNTDDGVRLWINGVPVIDRWQDQGPTEYNSGAVALNAGLVAVRMEYYENGGGALATLSWQGPGIGKAIIPSSSLVAGEVVAPEGPPVTLPAIPGQPQGPNVQSVGVLSSASSAISPATSHRDRHPSAIYRDNTGQPTGAAIVLQQSQMGYPFASGVPRFMLGDIVDPPVAQADGVTPAGSNYWRVQPVQPGEEITHPIGAPETPIPADTTLAYYYSPHAKKVFASQQGNVTIKWVSRVPAGNGRYQFRDETFTVSQTTRQPVKTLFWTEGAFKGPAVTVPSGRITSINAIYTPFFPRTVSQAYLRPGEVRDPGNPLQFPEIKTTLWFSDISSPKTLRAYNWEGRILVEYLGAANPDGVTFEFLGADVVEVQQQAPENIVDVKLGEQILPHDGDSSLLPSPLPETMNSTLYGTTARGDGRLLYYAERENLNPDLNQFYWLEQLDAAVYLGTTAPGLNLAWPKYLDKYRHLWPDAATDYAQLVVPNGGSTPDTRVLFSGVLPQIMWQDDATQSEASIDINSQGFIVNPLDGRNRTLLKFSSGSQIWYVRVNSQTEASLQNGTADGTSFAATATVGQRLERPAADLEIAGHISAGTIYDPNSFVNPYVAGVQAAAAGSIIPVNAMPGNNSLKVWWFRKITPPSDSFVPFYVATRLGTYTVGWPGNPPQIVLASNAGTGDLGPSEIAGSIYVQNDRSKAGFNPNEEHALMIAGRAYAMRDDLNVTENNGSTYTSEPFVLLSYIDAADSRPSMKAFKVLRENAIHKFDYPVTAGTILQGPMPLPVLPIAVDDAGNVKNIEVTAAGNDDAPDRTGPTALYDKFTFQDRKGFHWVYRGPHSGIADVNDKLEFQFYYTMQDGFHFPGRIDQPAVGTALPYLRPLDGNNAPVGDAVSGTPLTISYRPTWPVSPELRVGETLTLPKFGLPAVRGQTSAEILYQQSIALQGTAKPATTLHDSTRQKVVAIDNSAVGLTSLPGSAATTGSFGKIYFQLLPPHLQKRFYFDPLLGAKGSLVLKGEFVDEIAGEDYTNLNVLSPTDEEKLKSLVLSTDTDKSKWDAAIAALKTTVETFIENPARRGTYIADSGRTVQIDGRTLTDVSDSDTAVDSYALTATGKAAGYVTLLFGDGEAFTPKGEPVSVKIVKVAPQLYTGDLKVLLSENPLDEQVTLRHSGDFAARPEDYDFEWRYAPPQDGVSPPTYTYSMQPVLPSNNVWRLTRNPNTTLGAYVKDNEFSVRWSGYVLIPTTGTYTFYGATDDGLRLWIGDVSGAPVIDKWINRGEAEDATSAFQFTAGQLVPIKMEFFQGFGAASARLRWQGPSILKQIVPSSALRTPANLAGLTGEYFANPDLAGTPALVRRDTAVNFDWTGASTNSTLPRSLVIKDSNYDASGNPPGIALSSVSQVDFSAGVPDRIVFSATLATLDGLVLYVNGTPALSVNAPGFASTDSTAGLSPGGLTRQWLVGSQYFTRGQNTIDVALYTVADVNSTSLFDCRLEGSIEADRVVGPGSPWLSPTGTLTNIAVVGGSASSPLGSPLLSMSDNYFTMRYRPKTGTGNIAEGQWSRWMPAKLVEGWIKRVLAGINPFNQRVRDLLNNQVNTDVSLLTQAGKRWEGDVALNLNNIDDFGLIEIYETVLNRGKNMSIGSGYDYAPANDALLLAAGYLNDLYQILGNEAFADAANPTISIDDQSTVTEVNTSRFSFEGQVSSVLEEELALLRGRDDFLAPGVQTAPGYNRLYWNYTRGINSGEVLYATNYNIKEKAGSPTANGILDAADAQRMFPQGHGDAYGHYLTALTGYYQLLQSPSFTWTPRSEAVTVLGQAVQVDYSDERKFAAAAANVARTAAQTLALTHRQNYRDDRSAGWSHFRDGKTNPRTGVVRYQALDEWTSRSTQGALFNWVVGNAMLPEKDSNPNHTGVQVIDRTTVPELDELASTAARFQTTIDSANAHLNPLGLAPDAVAFDISPSELKAGKSHYEQIHERALGAVLNAKGAFDQAARMTRLLRNQENQVDDYNAAIVDEERSYNSQLLEIFGSPYQGDMGPGRTYDQDYTGPDLVNWFVVDRSTGESTKAREGTKDWQDDRVPAETLFPVDTSVEVPVVIEVPVRVGAFNVNDEEAETGFIDTNPADVGTLREILNGVYYESDELTVMVKPDRFIQYSDSYRPGVDLGLRPRIGKLQEALLELHETQVELLGWNAGLGTTAQNFRRQKELFEEMVNTHARKLQLTASTKAHVETLERLIANLSSISFITERLADRILNIDEKITDATPTFFGVAVDAGKYPLLTKVPFVMGANIAMEAVTMATQSAVYNTEPEINLAMNDLNLAISKLDFSLEEKQFIYEYEQTFATLSGANFEYGVLADRYQRAGEKVRTILAEGQQLLANREIFRKRAAAIIQGYRTKDLTFRTFRNEALEQYRTLFDLAGRYTYLAAKSYDYETGLLGTTQGRSVLSSIVASRALGDLSNNVPQATTSTLGDSGLAGTMARLQADWSVAKGRLGINNPDTYGTLFSLRREKFRILTDATTTSDDDAWRQALEHHIVRDVTADADVARNCAGIWKADGSAVPGIVIPFSTAIQQGENFFGLPLAGGDHAFSPSSFATKIYSAGMCFPGYVGMDVYANGTPVGGPPASGSPLSLSATPYIYLIPCGTDTMRAPAFGDTGAIRTWEVKDQALPLPFNLGAAAFNETQFFTAQGTLTEQPWILRKHQAFRAVADPQLFYGLMPDEFTCRRLVGRSAWNTEWKIVIPAYTLLNNEQEGLSRFVGSVQDIQLFLRTYSHSGN